MKLVAIVALSMFAGLAVPATAQVSTTPETSPATTTKPAATDPGQKIVCRTEDVIGSLVKKKRICMTLSEWRESAARLGNQMEQREVQRSGVSGG